MNKSKNILVAGGDLRQLYVAEELSESHCVSVIGFDKNICCDEEICEKNGLIGLKKRFDCIVLPIPVSDDGVSVSAPFSGELLPLDSMPQLLRENGIIFGGKIKKSVSTKFENLGIVVIDYLEREELSVLNAVPTAEGAIQIAMEELPTTVFGQKVLITGMGRISKVLVKILSSMGAEVTVTARRHSDLAWAEIFGAKSLHISKLDDFAETFDVIFNTVPSVIFDESRLKLLNNHCLVIDLASKPGGVDFNTARELGIKTIWALSLPWNVQVDKISSDVFQ